MEEKSKIALAMIHLIIGFDIEMAWSAAACLTPLLRPPMFPPPISGLLLRLCGGAVGMPEPPLLGDDLVTSLVSVLLSCGYHGVSDSGSPGFP